MDGFQYEGDIMTRDKQLFNHKVFSAAILILCLILPQAAIAATVNIDLNTSNQTIRGFGGMNFPRWIGTLTNAQVDTAFGNGPGQIGLTIMRIDVPPSTSNWSGQVAAAARAIDNHGAIVFASPWSPPASMKTNGELIQGELKTDSYGAFANYLTDFADYMSSNGAPLFAISVQNEPDWLPDYESCGYSPEQMQNFLNNNASVIPTKVIAPETVHYKENYVSAVASSSECDIVGVHFYGGTITYYSGKEYWMTEHYTSSDVSGDLWPDALEVGKEIHDAMTANMSAYIWWYIRRSYGPIDESGNVTKRGYVMSQYAKFVRPGYIKVNATANPSSGVYVTAYKSGDTLVIVAVNQNSSSSSVTFSLSGGTVNSYTKYETTISNNVSNQGSVGSTDTLAANSINTFVGSFDDGDATPPDPDPMEWTSGGEPASTGPTSITMTAATATDDIPPVEYYFECITDASKSSTWQTNTTYIAAGLNPSTEYSFRVKARDSSSNQNQTGWSTTESATTEPPDLMPPTPDPMEWAVGGEPSATGPSSITMTAETATDAVSPPVEYYFECTNYGDANSTWQSSPTYEAIGLDPLTLYTFRVKARDSYLTPNETGWSGTASATTDPPSTDVEILGSWATGTEHAKESGYSRALVFIAHAEHSGTVTLDSVTYGGQAMTKIIEESVGTGYSANVTAFILNEAGIDAATGGTFNPSWSAAPENTGYASVFLSNVDQTEPIGNSDKNGFESNTQNITTNPLSTGDGDMVFVGATCGNTGDYTVNSGFTEAYEHDMASSTGTDGYKSATGADEIPSVDFSATVNRQVIIGFVVQAMPAVDYQNCTQVQSAGYGLVSDLSGDCYVNLDDLDIVAAYWLNTNCGSSGNCQGADFAPTDGDVDFGDYSDFAIDWFGCNNPQDANCIRNW